jgi:NitT/TauT family transport system ATP-binding protein/sulfonate transport system ATP-binding protein
MAASNTESERARGDAGLAQGDVALSLRDVSRIYATAAGGTVEALSHVSLDVHRGEFVSLLGPSGCGKTTTLRLIAGLDQPQGGELTLDGEPIRGASHRRGFVFQQGALFNWLTIRENIAAGLRARHVYRENAGRVDELIHAVGLDGFGDAYPHQISGGMAQRVAIARALINDPEVLLLDEPMGALDNFTRATLQDLLIDLQRANHTTMVLVTHDVDEAIYLSDRIVIMTPRPGRVSEVVSVDFPRPRHRGGSEFLELRATLLEKFNLASAEPQPEYYI